MPRLTFKSFDEATAEMARAYWGQLGSTLPPDLVAGSAERSMLESVAFQVADLSARFDYTTSQAITEGTFEAFGFTKAPATKATTSVRFSTPIAATANIDIPLGSRVRTQDGIEYATTASASILVGTTFVDVAAEAALAGSDGNQAIGIINQLSSAIPKVSSATNTIAATGGSDEETLEAQKARFAEYLISLDKSTIDAITLALLNTSDAAGNKPDLVSVVDAELDNTMQAGTFAYYAYKKGGMSGELTSNLLTTALSNRAAGTQVITGTITVTSINVTLEALVSEAGQTTAITNAVNNYFNTLGIGEKLSFENLIAAIKNASANVIEPTLISPNADVSPSVFEKLELGSLSITETTS